MMNDFWSWKHLRPNNWMELLFGITVIGVMFMMLLIVIDVFLTHRKYFLKAFHESFTASFNFISSVGNRFK